MKKQVHNKRCALCGAEIEPGQARYCKKCAAEMLNSTAVCERCGAHLGRGERQYCKACRAKLEAAAKTVTLPPAVPAKRPAGTALLRRAESRAAALAGCGNPLSGLSIAQITALARVRHMSYGTLVAYAESWHRLPEVLE